MANLRPMLFMGLIVLSYLMWIEWQKDYGPQPTAATTSANPVFETGNVPAPQESSRSSGGDLPAPDAGNSLLNQDTTNDVTNLDINVGISSRHIHLLLELSL